MDLFIGLLVFFKLKMNMPFADGFYLFVACLPIAIAGYGSAIFQGRVAASGISLLAKNEEQSTKGIVYAVMVETYALFGIRYIYDHGIARSSVKFELRM